MEELVEWLVVPLFLNSVVRVVVANKCYNLIALEVIKHLFEVHLLLFTCIAEESAVCKNYDAINLCVVKRSDILGEPIVLICVETIPIALSCVRVISWA